MRRALFFASACLVLMIQGALAQVPQAQHVFVVVEGTSGYTSVINNSSMPYLNQLASRYGLATQFYANTHPAIGNYFTLTTGQTISNNPAFAATVSQENIVRSLMQSGKTWKSYAESLPAAGYTGASKYPYLKSSNPFSYFADVANSSSEKLNLVPLAQFSADLAAGSLPDFSFLAPNAANSLQGCPVGVTACTQYQKQRLADAWLQKNVAPLLASKAFQQDGLLMIVFSDAAASDTTRGGGRVAALLIGPKVKPGYKSTAVYSHRNLLKTALQALGVSNYPSPVATVAGMKDFFVAPTAQTSTATTSTTAKALVSSAATLSTTATTAGVFVSSPANGSTVSSTVRFTASANGGAYPITAMRIYVDTVNRYTVNAASLDTTLSLTAGTHSIVVQAWNSAGTVFKAPETITVSGAVAATTTTTSSTFSTLISPSTAYHLYVSTTGSDTNSGSSSAPFRHIQKAANVANPNTTIHVLPGVYVENVNVTRSGTSTGHIVFKSEKKWAASVQGNLSGGNFHFRLLNAAYIDIIGFDITGNSSTSKAAMGVAIYGPHNRIIGNHVHGMATTATSTASSNAGGIDVIWNGQTTPKNVYNEITNNVVHDIWSTTRTAKLGSCIYIADQHGYIANNLAYSCGSYGIQINHWSGYSTIVNNTVANVPNDAGIMMGVGGDSTYTDISDYNLIQNNIVVDSKSGISAWEGGPSSKLGIHNVWRNNLTYNNGINTTPGNTTSFSSKVAQSGDTHVNPAFVSKLYSTSNTGNFHLSSSSPGLNKGYSTSAPTIDLDGGARPLSGAWDLGSYEYGATPAAY
jgi:phosphatidylinositol-3-phosphatase